MNAGKIESILADLRKQRAAIEKAIEALEGVVGDLPADSEVAVPGDVAQPPARGMAPSEIPRNAFYGLKIPDAILHYLSVSKRKQTAQEIADALKAGGVSSKSKNFYSTVYTALVRLEEAGEVGKFGREWGLSAWFPGASRKRPKAGDENGGDEGDA